MLLGMIGHGIYNLLRSSCTSSLTIATTPAPLGLFVILSPAVLSGVGLWGRVRKSIYSAFFEPPGAHSFSPRHGSGCRIQHPQNLSPARMGACFGVVLIELWGAERASGLSLMGLGPYSMTHIDTCNSTATLPTPPVGGLLAYEGLFVMYNGVRISGIRHSGLPGSQQEWVWVVGR